MHETKRNIFIHLLKSKSDLPTVEFEFSHDALRELIEVLEEPNIPKGEWINNHTTCSKCGWQLIDDVVQSPDMVWFNFCPNCGADMREPEDIPMEYFESGGR